MFLHSLSQDDCITATERRFKKFKRPKIENDEAVDAEVAKCPDLATQIKHVIPCRALEETNRLDSLVNWMSMDETQFLNIENFKDSEFVADYEDTDDSDDEDGEYYGEDDVDIDDKDRKDDNSDGVGTLKRHLCEEGVDGERLILCSERLHGGQSEPGDLSMSQEINGDQNNGHLLPDARIIVSKRKLKKHNRKGNKKIKGYNALSEIHTSGQDVEQKGFESVSLLKKPPKVAFCPKEVKRIMESEALLLKNAQSHTIRKIIVFASLGIRHGCEDMYELDFNHFRILRKGEPYVSPKNPGVSHIIL